MGAALGGPIPGPVVWAGIVLVGVGLALGVTDGVVRRRVVVSTLPGSTGR